MKPFLPVTAVFSLLLLFSCSLDYTGSFMADEIAEDIPDTILNDFSHVAVRSGGESFLVWAARGENYDRKKESRFFTVDFQEVNALGEVVTSGSCDRAVLYLDSDNMDLWGNLLFYSSEEEATISADHLFWDDARGELTGDPGSLVVITRDSGASLQGEGFSAALRENRVEFRSRVKGVWVDDEN